MTDPLHIAVAPDVDPYWRALLQRSGLPVRELGRGNHAASVLFLPDAAGLRSPTVRELVASLRQAGRPLLAGARWGRELGAASPAGTQGVRDDRRAPMLVLPLPDARTLLRSRAEATALGAGGGPAPAEPAPVEIVAVVDHGALRRRIEAGLRQLSFAVGQPFVRLAHMPQGHDGALAVRVDADSYRADATASVVASLHTACLRATWCIDVERHLRHGGMPAVAALSAAGHEVQSHFFHHYTYRNARRNEANLRRSLSELAAIGISADAAAAPFGSWNPGLAQALQHTGMRWSSEFSRVYDEVPGPVSGAPGEVWQVPIHPVCPALFFAAGAGDRAVERWFSRELHRCRLRGEPAVFYGHPIADLERVPALLPKLAQLARSSCRLLWQPTMGELHAFAVARASQSIDVAVHENRLRGEVSGPAPLLVEHIDGLTQTLSGCIDVSLSTRETPVLLPRPDAAAAAPRHRSQPMRTRKLQLARLWRELRT